MNHNALYKSIYRTSFILLLGLIIFQFFRVALVINFSSWEELKNYKLNLFNAFFYTGLKFDTVAILYMLVIPFFCGIVSTFIPERFQGFNKVNLKINFWFPFVLYVLAIILLTCNYYFYKFFQSNFNLLVFGLIDDDTKAVVHSMWTDYPVIKIVIAWIIAAVILYFTIKKIISKDIMKYPTNLWLNSCVIFLCVILIAIGMRGSIEVFPLEKDDATISPNTFINSITMNGMFSLKDAFADYEKYAISTDSLVTLSKYGYNSKKEALLDFNGTDNELNSLVDSTAKSEFLEKNPPHVVFCLMESMSNYYFDLNSPSLNLMGELGEQLKDCFVFRNFTSGRNGTIHSLEGLMVSTPLTPLSQSSFMKTPLPSSVAKVFKDKGYETNFITGAKLGWRNLGKYSATQYFQNIEGNVNILGKVPNAKTSEWGVYDEFVFQRVFDILKNAKKPQFIFIFTTTNHTPYQLPDNYKPYPVKINNNIRKRLRCNADVAVKNFTAYQYANNSLGELIKKIRSSSLSESTIFAATGDHNTLALFDFDDSNMLMKHEVPFLIYAPNAYKPQKTDLTRFGSHKDIFPTLFNLSLSDTKYFKSGNNLFGPPTTHYFALNDFNKAFDKNGCAIITGTPIFFKWVNKKLVSCSKEENPQILSLLKYARAYSALLALDIQKQLLASKKENRKRIITAAK
jgi:phosphoglycerol transferase MdoB-like AlkP superfamily enzyme